MSTIVSWMDIQDATKFTSLQKTKRNQHSPVPLERLHTVGCPLDYATLLQCSNVACSVCSRTSWNNFWRYLWM